MLGAVTELPVLPDPELPDPELLESELLESELPELPPPQADKAAATITGPKAHPQLCLSTRITTSSMIGGPMLGTAHK